MNDEKAETPSAEPGNAENAWGSIKSALNQKIGFGKNKKEEVDYESLLMDSLPDEIRRRMPVATFTLMGASILMAIIMMCSTGSIEPDAQACAAYGANYRPLTFGGQLWRLFTSAFIHFDIKHLAMNMLCLFSIGCFLEKLIGHGKLLCAYVLTAFTGGMLSMIYHPDAVCAGASGAVFGLFGVGTMYMLLIWRTCNLNAGHVLGYMKNGLVFIGINFLYGLFPGVDMAAHIGGLVGGLVLGALMALPTMKKDLPYGDWYHRGITLAAVLLSAVMLVTVFTGRNADRLDTDALSAEVAKSVQNKLKESLENAGGNNVSVKIKNIYLFHDEGEKYHGLIEADLRCDGDSETLTKKIDVTYDGNNMMWVLED